MKKLLAIFTVLILVLALMAGCQQDEAPPEENPPVTDENTEEPPEDDAEEPGDTNGTGDQGAWEDDTYSAAGEPDDRGWKGEIEITVVDGEISSVYYDEVNEEGKLKSEDEEYAQSMSEATGVTPAEAYDQLQSDLIEKQNVDEVEVVSGATTSSELFKELAKEALPAE